MGMLVEGRWRTEEFMTAQRNEKGAFVRVESVFRDWIRADGSTAYPPERNRYHVFLAHS